MALINKKSFIAFPFILLLILSNDVFSQTLTSSPYTRFGIGDLVMKGFGRNKAMGDIGIALRSPYHLNNVNPASYTSMDSLSFLYEFGVSGRETQYVSTDQKFASGNANINFISIGFPVSKYWFSSVGLVPFSYSGYSTKTDTARSNIGTVENVYSGSGGINQFYIGNSIKLFKKLSLGINASYLFGSITQSNTTSLPDDVNSFAVDNQKVIKVSSLYFNYGIQYSDSIHHKYNYTIGLIFDNQSRINTSNSQFATNYLSANSTGSLDTLVNNTVKSHILFPYNAGIGLGFSSINNFTIGVDYVRQNWADSKFYESIDSLVNTNYIGFGVEWIPDNNAVSHYAKRICYRFGGHYSNTYLKIKGTQINDYGLSFGFGFPFRKSNTTLNVSFELGSRGTTSNSLLKENYGIITLNLTFFDNWFIRKRFE